MKANKEGYIIQIEPDDIIHTGKSVCGICGKKMEVCWDVVCWKCGKTFCYNHSIVVNVYDVGDVWMCKQCNPKIGIWSDIKRGWKRMLRKKRTKYWKEQVDILAVAVGLIPETLSYVALMLRFNILQLKINLVTMALGKNDAYNKAGRKSE